MCSGKGIGALMHLQEWAAAWLEFMVFDNPPSPAVLYFVNTDVAGVVYNRTSNYVLTDIVS